MSRRVGGGGLGAKQIVGRKEQQLNSGRITDASGTTNQKWLESAFLEKRAGAWKIAFMHSTRVPVAVEANHGK